MTAANDPPTDNRDVRYVAARVALVVLLGIMLVFGFLRFETDVSSFAGDGPPDPESFDYRYVIVPWLAYAHIVPGLAFLLIAPFQLWRGFRNTHIHIHRRMGRIGVVAALISGLFGTIFGTLLAFGGVAEALASAVFGFYFLVAVVVAYRAVRRKDIRTHRRWMIRAAALGLAVGTVRIWVGVLSVVGLSLSEALGIAFWLGFGLHALAAEAWLAWRPEASGRRRKPTPVSAGVSRNARAGGAAPSIRP
jgi:uncharacterized membrane protein YozB (DUF420 family)